MSDPNDRDRGRAGGRRRKPRGGGPAPHIAGQRRKERDYDDSLGPPRTPIILAKPSSGEPSVGGPGRSSLSSSPASQSRQPEKPVMVLKPREDQQTRSGTPTASLPTIPLAMTLGETTQQPAYQLQRTVSSQDGNKVSGSPDMNRCVKLVDETGQWSDAACELLLDHTDYLVVGVLGGQGCGKSTLLSLLAGSSDTDSARSYPFQPQTRDIQEECAHQTNGVDIFVTSQRIIFLDTQPLLSPSVLDNLIQQEKKPQPEYVWAENSVEMQSLQLAAFLLTVCNVVLVVQDWFCDLDLLRTIQTAEMLKPSTPSSSHEGGAAPEEAHEYFPHVVFVQNKASRDSFGPGTQFTIQQTLGEIFATSKMKMNGLVSMPNSQERSAVNPNEKSDLNLFLLPVMAGKKQEQAPETILTLLPEYRGYPSFRTLINSLRSQIFSLQRDSLTHTTLSEKNWFHYAARTWDSMRKSSLMSEYNRLLP